jgi:hypothetical protein
MSRKIEIGLFVMGTVIGLAQWVYADPCQLGQAKSFVTTCPCTNRPATAYYCAACEDGSNCAPCSLSLPGIYCGSSGKNSCYVSGTSYDCIDPPRSQGRRDMALSDGPSFNRPATARHTTGVQSGVGASGPQQPQK